MFSAVNINFLAFPCGDNTIYPYTHPYEAATAHNECTRQLRTAYFMPIERCQKGDFCSGDFDFYVMRCAHQSDDGGTVEERMERDLPFRGRLFYSFVQ